MNYDKDLKAYLIEDIRLLDEWAAELYENLFGKNKLNKFKVDFTNIKYSTLEKAFIAEK
ncbi:MAG: hypothetical protein ACTSRP_10730 [Candidatus Helarchaeota archaeon]